MPPPQAPPARRRLVLGGSTCAVAAVGLHVAVRAQPPGGDRVDDSRPQKSHGIGADRDAAGRPGHRQARQSTRRACARTATPSGRCSGRSRSLAVVRTASRRGRERLDEVRRVMGTAGRTPPRSRSPGRYRCSASGRRQPRSPGSTAGSTVQGGFAVIEADDPKLVATDIAPFVAWFEFAVHPVLDITGDRHDRCRGGGVPRVSELSRAVMAASEAASSGRMTPCRRTSRSCGRSTWGRRASSPRATSSPPWRRPAARTSRRTSTPATSASPRRCARGQGRGRAGEGVRGRPRVRGADDRVHAEGDLRDRRRRGRARERPRRGWPPLRLAAQGGADRRRDVDDRGRGRRRRERRRARPRRAPDDRRELPRGRPRERRGREGPRGRHQPQRHGDPRHRREVVRPAERASSLPA